MGGRVLTFYNLLDREYYRIFNVNSGLALDTWNTLCTRNLLLGYLSQFWELQKPVVSVPAGWLRIQNVASSQVLSQTCSSLPPITVPPPTSPTPNESWATQWVFVQASTFGDSSAGNRSYVIKNRLTGTILRCEKSKEFHREAVGSINAWDPKCYGNDPELWSFEVDADGNWRVAHKSRLLLEETDVELLGGNEVICTTRTHDNKKCWAFV